MLTSESMERSSTAYSSLRWQISNCKLTMQQQVELFCFQNLLVFKHVQLLCQTEYLQYRIVMQPDKQTCLLILL